MDTNVPGTGEAMDDEQKGKLLAVVNATLAGMQSSMKYRKILEIPGCESLRGKKIVMVDDLKNILEAFVAPLTVATGGNAGFIQYTGQQLDEIVHQILTANPDILLVDFHLSDSFKGDQIVRKLVADHPEIACVGFSSEKEAQQQFIRAGAKGVVTKSIRSGCDSAESGEDRVISNKKPRIQVGFGAVDHSTDASSQRVEVLGECAEYMIELFAVIMVTAWPGESLFPRMILPEPGDCFIPEFFHEDHELVVLLLSKLRLDHLERSKCSHLASACALPCSRSIENFRHQIYEDSHVLHFKIL